MDIKPPLSISDLINITPEESQSICAGQNRPEYLNHTIIKVFKEQVKNNPNHLALVDDHVTYTYQEMDDSSDALANWLLQQGVKSQTGVALYMHRSALPIIAMFAIMKLGAYYIPLDKRWPQSELSARLESCSCDFVLTNLNNTQLVSKAKLIYVNHEIILNLEKINDQSKSAIEPTMIAYKMFTSGSTGKPKQVSINHQSIVNLAISQGKYLKIDNQSRVLQFAPICFDASVYEWALALLNGATLYIIQNENELAGIGLENYIQKNQIQITLLPPSIINTISSNNNISLKTLITGGEEPNAKILNKWSNTCDIYNAYGLTETAVYSCITKLCDMKDCYNIGSSIPNTKMYILDDKNKIVPYGVVGQIAISGAGVAHNGDMDNKSLIKNPFNHENNPLYNYLYLTGDSGMMRRNGDIEFIGRTDDQIKINGNRTTLSSIRNEILKVSNIKDCFLMTVDNNNLDVIAYIIPEIYSTAGAHSELESELRKNLPNYMRPKKLILLNHFPLTINGKVDKKALLKMLPQVNNKASQATVEKTQTQKRLISIWANVLDKAENEILITTSFIDLGGDSLKAIELINVMSNVFNIELETPLLFECETIEKISEHIDKQTNFVKPIKSNESLNRDVYLSLDKRQIALYEKFGEKQHKNIVVFKFQISGKLNEELFRQACQLVLDNNDILRANIQRIDNELKLKIPSTRNVSIEEYDLRALSASKQQSSLDFIYSEAVANAFDVIQDPFLKFILNKVSNNEFILYVSLYHLACDLQSLDLVIQQLINHYHQLYYNEKPKSVVSPRFSDHISRDEYYLNSSDYISDKQFWETALKHKQKLINLKALYKGNQEIGEYYIDLTSTYSKLKVFAHSAGVTLFASVLGVFQYTLFSLLNQKSFCIGIPISKRQSSFYQNMCGPFNTRIPFMCYQTDNVKISITRTFQHLNNVRKHVQFPVDELVPLMEGDPEFELHHKFYDVIFDYEQEDYCNGNLFSINKLPIPDELKMKHLIFARLHEYEDKQFIKIRFRKDIIDLIDANQFMNEFKKNLIEICQEENDHMAEYENEA